MKWTYSILALLLLPTLVAAQTAKSYGSKGNSAYSGADYELADSLYSSSLALNPKMDEAAFNRGDALYRQGKFEEAAQQFSKIARESEDEN
jgi:tetratricopeptide (TPR) repeat protein